MTGRKKKPFGVLGGIFIVTFIVVAFLAPYIAPCAPGDFAGSRLESPSGLNVLTPRSISLP